MKFAKTVIKNFKVLFRLKTSLATIILGPLLVIFLIGFAFSSTSNIQVSLGIIQYDQSPLTVDIISSLQTTDYLIKEYTQKETCESDIKQGLIHACIIFPENFVISNNKTNNIIFIVDKSRINIVYTVIERVSKQIGLKEDELSLSLTETITNTLQDTATGLDQTIGSLIKLKKNIADASSEADVTKNTIQALDTNMVTVKVDYTSDFNTLHKYTQNIASDVTKAANEGLALIEQIDAINASLGNEVELIFQTLKDDATFELNDSAKDLLTLQNSVITAQDKLDELQTKFEAVSSAKETIILKLTTIQNQLQTIKTEITNIQSQLETLSQQINRIEVTSSEQIAKPITTTIETVSTDKNQLVILFPYVTILIIMFVGLMLASTLVVVEKKSKASFRIFTTPTRDDFFIGTTFVTAFIIILIQVLLILGAVTYFVSSLIITNLLVNSIILILAIALFIFIGMTIGYIMSNQQGTNMASISIGALFLFLSNILLPIESISPYLQNIARFNPYVLASESLRKSLLFSTKIAELGNELFILVIYSIALYGVIILTQQISKMKYFNKNPHGKHKHQDIGISGLIINNTVIKTETEFIQFIHSLDEPTFKKCMKKNKKQIKLFLKDILQKEELAKEITKLNKKEVLQKFVTETTQTLEKMKEHYEHRTIKQQQKENKK